MKIQIDKIKIKENIRKDYGDLTELAASIREHGVRQPVELNKQDELVDGYRRVKVAKIVGLKEIPYFYSVDELDRESSQLLAGIFQKNLNPIEEGKAFKKYLGDKRKVEDLAKKISKKVNYVEKRLVLVNLPVEVQEALIKGKIQMGHALLLARFPKDESNRYLKHIIREKYGVEEARDRAQYSGRSENLSGVRFNKEQCRDCQYNGSKQSELFETGQVLSGNCLNPGCFRKKLKEFVKSKREEFKDVLYKPESEYSDPKGYVNGEYDYSLKSAGISKSDVENSRKNKENYLVKIRDDGRITEYFKIPPTKKLKDGSKQAVSKEEALEERREETL